jgi:hypothetical protein
MNKQKALKMISLSVIFFIFLTFLLYLLRRFVPDGLVFDQILYLSLIFLIFATFISTRSFQRVLPQSQLAVIVLIVTFFFYSFYSVMLVNIDRSRSFYVLSWVEKDKIYYENGKIQVSVESREADNSDGVEQRIIEQKDRGLIKISGDKVQLTLYGKNLLMVSNTFASIFTLKNWELNNY